MIVTVGLHVTRSTIVNAVHEMYDRRIDMEYVRTLKFYEKQLETRGPKNINCNQCTVQDTNRKPQNQNLRFTAFGPTCRLTIWPTQIPMHSKNVGHH